MSFFEKLDLEKKLNIYTGNFFEKSNGFPSRDELVKILANQITFENIRNIKDKNSFFEIGQALIDSVSETKDSLYQKIKGVYEYKQSTNSYLEVLMDADLVGAIITTNYGSTTVEDNSGTMVITPYDDNKIESEKTRLYKVLGDLNNPNKCAITAQDFRKLRVLPFYENFWNNIRKELKNRCTIFLGIDFNDSDFFAVLEYILSKDCNDVKPMYIITSNSIISPKITEFFNKYNIKVLASTEYDFFKELKNYTENENIDLLRLFPEMYRELMNEKKFQW